MFGYTCEECGEGTVRETHVRDFEVAFDRMPFVVPDAVIGICDECGAQHFNVKEYKRWRKLFEEQRTEAQRRLLPQEIRALREKLGLTMTDFAALIGVTRQSVSYWETEDRTSEQSRSADLLLRLVRASGQDAPIDVLNLLLDQARSAGIDIQNPLRAHSRASPG